MLFLQRLRVARAPYRWFCRLSLEDDIPDHSSLSRIRNRYGEKIFEAVFRRIVGLCGSCPSGCGRSKACLPRRSRTTAWAV
jgi:hypothetical protein